MQITIYSQKGEAVGKATVPDEIFATEVNEELVHRAIVRQNSNARHPIAHTLTRAERAGSTRKLFRQKGTGRARPGDNRTPNRRKGGVSMGPRNERNFELSMSKGEQKKALFSTLTMRAADESVFGLEGYTGEMKTKAFSTMLSKLPVKGKVLVVLSDKDALIEKSSRNLPNVTTLTVNYLNPRDVLGSGSILFVGSSLDRIPEIWKVAPARTTKQSAAKATRTSDAQEVKAAKTSASKARGAKRVANTTPKASKAKVSKKAAKEVSAES